MRQAADKLGDRWPPVAELLADESRAADAARPEYLQASVLQGYGSGVAGVAALLAKLGPAFVEEQKLEEHLRTIRRLPAAAQRLAASRDAPPGRRLHAAAEGVEAARQAAAEFGESVAGPRAARVGRAAAVSARDRTEMRRVLALERLGTLLEAYMLSCVDADALIYRM